MSDIGDAIKAAREVSQLKAYEFARLCGMTPAAISQIEKGTRTPSLPSLQKMLSVLGLTFEQLCKVERGDWCPLCKQKLVLDKESDAG